MRSIGQLCRLEEIFGTQGTTRLNAEHFNGCLCISEKELRSAISLPLKPGHQYFNLFWVDSSNYVDEESVLPDQNL